MEKGGKKMKKGKIIFGLWKFGDKCSKCNSKNIYYSLQKKVIFNVAPNGCLIKFEDNQNYHRVITHKEKSLMYWNSFNSDEIEYCTRTCLDCDFTEEIDLIGLEDEE